jgi:hypothetical protein
MSSNDSDPSALLPNQSPPLSVITATDQRGVVLIATALSLSFALISMLIRLFIRLEFRHRFARDDAVAVVAMVSLVLRCTACFTCSANSTGIGFFSATIHHRLH